MQDDAEEPLIRLLRATARLLRVDVIQVFVFTIGLIPPSIVAIAVFGISVRVGIVLVVDFALASFAFFAYKQGEQ